MVENALDVPHTAILHRGLFRGVQRHRVEVVLRRYRNWAEAQYLGEPPPQGFVARLISLGAKGKELTVEHWDRFFLPSVLQVEYRLGDRIHFLITGYCTPTHEKKTQLFAVACVRTPLPPWLTRILVRLIEPFAMRVFRQDVVILSARTENIAHFEGEQFMSTEIDVLGASVTRLLKDASERETHDGANERGTSESAKPETEEPLAPENEEPRELVELSLDA